MKTKNTDVEMIAVGENRNYNFHVKHSNEIYYQGKKVKTHLYTGKDGASILMANGFRYIVEILSNNQNSYEILINGRTYSFSVETPFSLKRSNILKEVQDNDGGEEVFAQMPGKIIDIMVHKGQEVKQGEPLLIFEAMKMQNTIQTTTSGIVEDVRIAPGDNVAKNELLVKIKKSAKN
ncbi:2-oxoglutarate carboxylase large subunit [Salinivirga cyanobacteriivorans]|uniref:2-oxoglutarate carboxylase large subunit n=1 Tax=Salinivirga cyanobacteriivorans TaxID=1307839 RepID=A0A0S2I552_9BACT|nr:acetyl-CoA carboxylase biotin carboxyl carrier protein subunit [Salinivirga cyanobacteriivorans]ALO17348.1 2-oxoglutarate carboxylase large subunit [Salinivirga cyanobacteriivorans]